MATMNYLYRVYGILETYTLKCSFYVDEYVSFAQDGC